MLSVYGVVVHVCERRPVSELAWPPAVRELGLGLLMGLGLYTLCMAVLMLSGSYRIHGMGHWQVLVSGLAIALATGVFEELLFRAGLFRLAEEWFGTWWALLISSVVFGFTHLDNEAASLQGVVSISIWAGALLAGCYVLTRRMWLGIGLHAAWNYTQGFDYVYWNMMHDSWYFSIATLPESAKNEIILHLENAAVPAQWREEFDRICDFMRKGASTDGFMLRMKVRDLDRKRGQNLATVEPEFAALIDYKYE
jgi:membrane protease YdiL (CAAX protease family)